MNEKFSKTMLSLQMGGGSHTIFQGKVHQMIAVWEPLTKPDDGPIVARNSPAPCLPAIHPLSVLCEITLMPFWFLSLQQSHQRTQVPVEAVMLMARWNCQE